LSIIAYEKVKFSIKIVQSILEMEICGDIEADYRIAIIFLEAHTSYPDFFGYS
jgi:hypothetical protein